MRKLCESTLVSLDGVVTDAHLWAMDYFGPEAEEEALRRLLASDALLMGRRTYEIFAEAWPRRTGDFADRINAIRKYVFSSSLPAATWNNTHVIRGDAVAEVTRLKREDGRNLAIYGHGRLTQALFDHGLVDELRCSIHPVFVGQGGRLFREGRAARLQPVATRMFATGVVSLTYRVVETTARDAGPAT